jgi:hypothetical protein
MGADLEKNGNIYLNLSQSAYNNRPNSLSYDELNSKQKEQLNNNNSIGFYYGKPVGKVYLQPDPTVKTIKEQPAFPLVNAPATINSYQKGLLTDKKAA